MIRNNHYEQAFEAWLRSQHLGYVAVDETRRSIGGDESVKSADFIVVGPDSSRLVIDVKGRRFPSGSYDRPQQTWQSWAEEEDVRGLRHWAERLGPDYRPVLAFIYHIMPPYTMIESTQDVFQFKGSTYLMRAVLVDDYEKQMRPRSAKWGTVHVLQQPFRRLVKPFSHFMQPKPGPS